MEKTNRDATNPFKGYEYQFYYFIKIILEKHQTIQHIIFEGCEDIDVLYTDGKYSCIQIKYHSEEKPKEGFGKDAGFTKVLNAYMGNYENKKKKEDINEIIYFINNECNLDSPEFKTMYDNDKDKIYDLLIKKYPDHDQKEVFSFCQKIKIYHVDNFEIKDIFNEINGLIGKIQFFEFGNNDVSFKKDIIHCKLHKLLIEYIFENKKEKQFVVPQDLFNKIKQQIKNEYTEKILFDEIISMFNSDKDVIRDHINNIIMMSNDLDKFDLSSLYEILHKTNVTNYEKIKLIIIKKAAEQIYKNCNNYEKAKFCIDHMYQLTRNKKKNNGPIDGTRFIDAINNLNNDIKIKKSRRGKPKAKTQPVDKNSINSQKPIKKIMRPVNKNGTYNKPSTKKTQPKTNIKKI